MSSAPDVLAVFRESVAAVPQDTTTPARIHNRLMKLVLREADRLSSTTDGRAALEFASTNDPNPWVRLSASAAVQAWNLPLARFAFVDIVEASGGQIVMPMTMTSALSVLSEPGRSAALCLMNLDSGRRVRPESPANERVASALVPAADLDAAMDVVGLAMNGGLGHAYEAAGDLIPAARRALDAVSESSAARVLSDLLSIVGLDPSSTTMNERTLVLASLDSAHIDQIEQLSLELIGMKDVLDAIEAANEA